MAPPEAFNYQALARDNAGNILANQNVSFRMSILKTTVNGTVVYSETHTLTTDAYGLANLAIGTGTILSGVFANIDWAVDNYFFKTEFDQNGGSNYLLMGTSQLLSVPYALHAKTVSPDGFLDPHYPDGIDGETVLFNGPYTVPSGKNLIINRKRGDFAYSMTFIRLGVDTLWGDWHYVPENSVVNTSYGGRGILFDKKTQFVSISTTSTYTVPSGKKLYLFLPTFSSITVQYFGTPGGFRINGNDIMDEYNSAAVDEEEPRLIILPSGATINYIDDPSNSYDLPPRVFTGYLK